MDKWLQFKHLEIQIFRDEAGFFIHIHNQENKENWDSGPYETISELVSYADKALLWNFEVFENRHCEERKTVRHNLQDLAMDLEIITKTEIY